MSHTPIPLADDALPRGWGRWDLPAGWQLEPNGGPGGTPALRLTRTDPAEYLNARLRFSLPAGERYRLSASIRVENAAGPDIAACAGIECFDTENRYLGGGYVSMVSTPATWVAGQGEFTVPAYTAECRLMFYLRAGDVGTARFAAPVIAPAPFRWSAYPLTPVRDELPASGGEIPFGFFSLGAPAGLTSREPWRCRVELLAESKGLAAMVAPIRAGRFTINLGALPDGPALLRFTLLDASGGTHGEHRLPVTIVDERTERERAATGCVMDRRGRIRIRNRPFLPLALYMGVIERAELDDLAGTAFNCLIPYGSCELRFADSARQGLAAIREVLDECDARGIKIVFSLAHAYDEPGRPAVEAFGVKSGMEVTRTAVREFARHPALLAWYINDEQPINRLPHLLERRRLIRHLDPCHPIYAVMCQWAELPFYTETVDVFGIDPYPIVDPACNHLRPSRYAHDMAEQALGTPHGIALWTVVQAHNIGAYDPKARVDPAFYREAYRDPSFDEMLGLALLAALRGAKGFVFFSYPDLGHPAFDADARPRRWANLRRVGQTLRDLEPFLLADALPHRPPLQVAQGEVEARVFHDDAGRVCVLLVGIGPGPCRAELTPPAGTELFSQFGRTVALGGGQYRFEGADVCADLLLSRDTDPRPQG